MPGRQQTRLQTIPCTRAFYSSTYPLFFRQTDLFNSLIEMDRLVSAMVLRSSPAGGSFSSSLRIWRDSLTYITAPSMFDTVLTRNGGRIVTYSKKELWRPATGFLEASTGAEGSHSGRFSWPMLARAAARALVGNSDPRSRFWFLGAGPAGISETRSRRPAGTQSVSEMTGDIVTLRPNGRVHIAAAL